VSVARSVTARFVDSSSTSSRKASRMPSCRVSDRATETLRNLKSYKVNLKVTFVLDGSTA
jgi:hypothetical protein